MVLIEAKQHGIACISANCPTSPDDIITLDSGYLYEPFGDYLVACLEISLQ